MAASRNSIVLGSIVLLVVLVSSAAPAEVQRAIGRGVTVIGDEAKLPGCIAKSIKKDGADLTYIDSRIVRDRFYPWLEPAQAPKTLVELREFLSRKAAMERLRSLGLRYILTVEMQTSTKESETEEVRALPITIELLVWVSVWDIVDPELSQKYQATVRGTVREAHWLTSGFRCFFHQMGEPCLDNPRIDRSACEELAPLVISHFASAKPH